MAGAPARAPRGVTVRALRPLAEALRVDAALRADAARARTVLAARRAANGVADIALYVADPRRFVALLFGAWQAGLRVWLAADRAPATLAALRAADVVVDVDIDLGAGAGATIDPPNVDDAENALRDADAERLVLFTSGSTGAPQPIGKSLRQLDAEIAALEQAFGARLGDAAVQGTVSHQHIYGLLFRVLWPLAAGRAFAAPRIEFPGQWAAQAATGDVLVSTPSMLAQWPAQVGRPTPRLVVSSGGALPLDVAARVRAHLAAPVVEIFGSTETGGIAWREAACEPVGGLPACGAWQPLPGICWRIEDGQLSVRSPHLQDPSTWCRTADLVEASEGGFVLRGRADRIAKVGEKRVSLDGLEVALRGTGLVGEARALDLPALGRRLAVVAVPTDEGRAIWNVGGRRALSAELRHALLARFESAAVPRHWRFVDALPSNAQGKITEAALALLFRPRAAALVDEAGAERTDAPGDGGSSSIVMTLDVPSDLLFFDGHFDAAAVVPGVVLLDWAIAQVEQHFGLAPPLAGIEVLKFQKVVLPDARLTLRLERSDARTVGFAYGSDEGNHASGRLRYVLEAAA